MAVFEELSMLALVHANGDLTALPMPKASNGAVAASSSGPAFSAVGVPASRPAAASGSGVMFGAASLHTWNPRMAHIKAHKHPVVATSSLVSLLLHPADSALPAAHSRCSADIALHAALPGWLTLQLAMTASAISCV